MTRSCGCEHIVHDTEFLEDVPDTQTTQGCPNPATIVVSPSWTICTDCESTMGVNARFQLTATGPYAGLAWHQDDARWVSND